MVYLSIYSEFYFYRLAQAQHIIDRLWSRPNPLILLTPLILLKTQTNSHGLVVMTAHVLSNE